MTIKENLELLLAAIENQPEESIKLNSFKQETACGTLFCSLGLACSMPEFQAMGYGFYEMVIRGVEYSRIIYHAELNGECILDNEYVVNNTFGTAAYNRLFEPRGAGYFDAGLIYWDEATSDKQLAILRLKKQLENYND